MPRTAMRPKHATPPREPAPAPRPPVDAPAAADPLRHEVEGIVYALDALPRRHGRKSVVTVRTAGADAGAPLVDRCDLYSFRSRRGFAQLVADVFAREVGAVLGHLALVLDACERAHAAGPCAQGEKLTPERRRAAEELLLRPDLLDRAAAAMEALGHVGEEQVKRLCFLVALSRLSPRPLSALLLAPPGTGKSAVLEAVAALVPPEHQVTVARITAQSLFYAGAESLRHRLLLVDEYEGQADADHAVRVLQSKGELTQTSTVKGKAEQFTVRGPVAIMSGTTSTSLDLQNTSRCLELALDDSLEQTKRIQAAQARHWSGSRPRGLDLQAWQDAQRLLAEAAPVEVVIPYAPRLEFPARTTADRRGSAKLLGLIAAHALLHARQRERDKVGRLVARTADYAAVHALVQPVLEHAAQDLSPRAARVYRWLLDHGAAADRREIATALGWAYNTAKKALAELEAQELVRQVEPGPPARYRPLGARSVLGHAAELTPPSAL